MPENINCYAKYSPDQPRDERGRWGVGNVPSASNRPGNGMPHAFSQAAAQLTNDAFGLTANHDSAARNAEAALRASTNNQGGQAARYHRQAAAAHTRAAKEFAHVPAHAARHEAAAAAHTAAASEHREHNDLR